MSAAPTRIVAATDLSSEAGRSLESVRDWVRTPADVADRLADAKADVLVVHEP